jgi:hypothetical protein
MVGVSFGGGRRCSAVRGRPGLRGGVGALRRRSRSPLSAAALDAIEDELRRFPADGVLICTYPPGASNWLETGIVNRLREEFDICVTHVIVGMGCANAAPRHRADHAAASARVAGR